MCSDDQLDERRVKGMLLSDIIDQGQDS